MDRQDIAREFESILAAEYGLDPVACREGEDWWRFILDGRDSQGGAHSADFRVLTTLCATGTDADLDTMFAELARHNADLRGARFVEADCYLHVQSECSFAELTPTRMREMLAACVEAARSPAGTGLRSKYRSWD